MKKITAQAAYKTAASEKIKFQERGYGRRVIFINECPDCLGRGQGCGTCGNEPDDTSNKVKVGKFWYEKLAIS